jgi:magnesium chelatase family protein
VQRRDYRARVGGPVTDRIDIVRHLEPLRPHQERDRFAVNESTATVRARVERARARQEVRFRGCSWRLNGHAPGPALRARWPLPDAAQRLVDAELYEGRLSRRGVVRVHRLAWTVADLHEVDRPGVAEVDVALRLRKGDPLMLATLVWTAG